MNFSAVWILVIFGACLVSGARNPRFNIRDSYTKFASQLVDTIADALTDNFVVSPLSLAQALTIASHGASGQTLEELRQVLRIPDPINGKYNKQEVLKASQKLIMRLQRSRKPAPSLSEALKLIDQTNNIGKKHLQLEVPNFVIESEHDLIETMKTMGVESMFSYSAEFPIFDDGEGGLHVSSLIQKSYIKVIETGVEASASTLMESTFLSARIDLDPELVRFDHPFFAYITYKSIHLFAMRVTDPGH